MRNLFSLTTLKIIFLPSIFRSLIKVFFVCGFLYSNVVWGFTRSWTNRYIYNWPYLRRWEVFRSFPLFFSGLLSFSSPFMTEITNAIFFVIIPHIPEALLVVSFQSVFFLLFRLGNFYCFFFQFNNCFLCPLHSGIEPIHWVFIFAIMFFNSKISLWLFFIASISLLELLFLRYFYLLFFNIDLFILIGG